MCGFVGIYDVKKQMQYDIEKMLRVIRHRGPDQQRIQHMENGIMIAFARLAIIDLKGGAQPMSNVDNSITVMLNGEIYNYIELRNELQNQGYWFKTESDTEVLLRLYEHMGLTMLEHIQGMFAITIIDRKLQEIYLVRDRLGIKPLYYSNTKDGLCGFASEIKPLLQLPFVTKTIRKQSVADFLEFEYVHAPYTIFEDIKKIMPGHYVRISSGNLEEVQYWDCNAIEQDCDITVDQAKDKVIRGLKESLQLHLRSDVPLGCFLSGGIDSGLLVALASEQVASLDTYTLRFENGDFDEANLAKLVADRYHTNHHCYTVKAEDFKRMLPEISWFFDEPIGDSGTLPNYILNELVAKDGTKVILSGAGGDELFGGYSYYFQNCKEKIINKMALPSKLFSKVIRSYKPNISDKLDRTLLYRESPFKHMIACERTYSEQEIAEIVGILPTASSIKQQYANKYKYTDLNRQLYVDLKTYLMDDLLLLSDRSCMAYSIEGRVPFLHHPFVEMALSIPEHIKAPYGKRKWLLKEVARPYLPEMIYRAPKMGFCSPIQRWANAGLSEFAYTILNSERAMNRAIWDIESYKTYVSDKSRYVLEFHKIYLLLILEIFFRVHVDNNFESKQEIDQEKLYGKG